MGDRGGLGGEGTPLRVLLVTDSLDIGGGERHVVELAVALREVGHEVVVASSAGGTFRTMLECGDVPVRVLGNRLVKRRVSLALAGRVRRLVLEGGFHVVHGHMYASSTASALATLGLDVPLVMTAHSEANWRTCHARWMSRWAYQRASAVIAVSDPIRRRLIEQEGVSADRVALIPSGIPTIPPVTGSQWPPWFQEGPSIGVVARLQPEKGVDFFLRAAVRIHASFPACRFLIVGDGPLRQPLEARAERLGLGEQVHFLGCCADARPLIGLLDVLAVPSLSEGAPLVVLEAMSLGVPVVATQVGGIPDQIRDGREGLLVPPGDPHAMAAACLELLHNPDRARRLTEAARRRAVEFSHTAMVRRIEAVYRGVLLSPGNARVSSPMTNSPHDHFQLHRQRRKRVSAGHPYG